MIEKFKRFIIAKTLPSIYPHFYYGFLVNTFLSSIFIATFTQITIQYSGFSWFKSIYDPFLTLGQTKEALQLINSNVTVSNFVIILLFCLPPTIGLLTVFTFFLSREIPHFFYLTLKSVKYSFFEKALTYQDFAKNPDEILDFLFKNGYTSKEVENMLKTFQNSNDFYTKDKKKLFKIVCNSFNQKEKQRDNTPLPQDIVKDYMSKQELEQDIVFFEEPLKPSDLKHY